MFLFNKKHKIYFDLYILSIPSLSFSTKNIVTIKDNQFSVRLKQFDIDCSTVNICLKVLIHN